MAGIFPKNRIRELASGVEVNEIREHISTVERWLAAYRDGSLAKEKETSLEQQYNTDFFQEILGYVSKPQTPYTFLPKDTTTSNNYPDAVLCFRERNSTSDEIFAAVELKGTAVDLDKPQKRESNLSPVQQGFKYKAQYRSCPFVIVSNFWEFRLYSDTMLDYEVWTLADLADASDDYLNFRVWYFLLHSDRFISADGVSETQKLITTIRIEQEAIGDAFFAQYTRAREVLIADLAKQNLTLAASLSDLVNATQKLLDRIVFICFAEDTGLLPDNSLHQILAEYKNSTYAPNLWSTMTAFFRAVDSGSERLGIPTGYNGGLFRFDPFLDAAIVGDDALRELISLATFDFSSDLDVPILGQIFERSITDLENLRTDLGKGGTAQIANLPGRRKSEGVYYTPQFVVKRIVEESLGAYLREKERGFQTEAGLKSDILDKTYRQRELEAYENYRRFLQQIKVLDPACGSGAFLVGIFDYLQEENRRVDEILGGTLLSQEEYVRNILRNNIYGVDLSAESVEITKLSLWLRTAEKNSKLTSLDENIQVGNSLVSDEEVAGKKAVDWARLFPEVMGNGGFDVVVGNPPYVDSQTMVRHQQAERKWISENWRSASGNWDLYVPFLELSLQLLRPGGFMGMIVPNKVLSVPYASEFRQIVSDDFALRSIIDCSRDRIFDVAVYPVIITVQNTEELRPIRITNSLWDTQGRDIMLSQSLPVSWATLFSSTPQVEVELLPITDYFVVASSGATNEAYELRAHIHEEPLATSWKGLVTGSIDPYRTLWGEKSIRFLKRKYTYPVIDENGPKDKSWYSKDKIFLAGLSLELEAALIRGNEFFPMVTIWILYPRNEGTPLEALLAYLNTEFATERYRVNSGQESLSGGYMSLSRRNLEAIRIPESLPSDPGLIRLSRQRQSNTDEFARLDSAVTKTLRMRLGEFEWPNRYNGEPFTWWGAGADLLRAIKRTTVPLAEVEEINGYIQSRAREAVELLAQIETIDLQIENRVRQLHGLEPDSNYAGS